MFGWDEGSCTLNYYTICVLQIQDTAPIACYGPTLYLSVPSIFMQRRMDAASYGVLQVISPSATSRESVDS